MELSFHLEEDSHGQKLKQNKTTIKHRAVKL